jgi:hypothetical protein
MMPSQVRLYHRAKESPAQSGLIPGIAATVGVTIRISASEISVPGVDAQPL